MGIEAKWMDEGVVLMNSNWIDNLQSDERKILNMLSGALGLPHLVEYESKVHFLNDVYSRICEPSSLVRQLGRILNSGTW